MQTNLSITESNIWEESKSWNNSHLQCGTLEQLQLKESESPVPQLISHLKKDSELSSELYLYVKKSCFYLFSSAFVERITIVHELIGPDLISLGTYGRASEYAHDTL